MGSLAHLQFSGDVQVYTAVRIYGDIELNARYHGKTMVSYGGCQVT
jgi:hypothetical protein